MEPHCSVCAMISVLLGICGVFPVFTGHAAREKVNLLQRHPIVAVVKGRKESSGLGTRFCDNQGEANTPFGGGRLDSAEEQAVGQ